MERICPQFGRPGFDPWIGKIPWRRAWKPTPGLLPGKFHGQRCLVGYSPWGRKESKVTEGTKYTRPKRQACCALEEHMFHFKNMLNVSPLGTAIQNQESGWETSQSSALFSSPLPSPSAAAHPILKLIAAKQNSLRGDSIARSKAHSDQFESRGIF